MATGSEPYTQRAPTTVMDGFNIHAPGPREIFPRARAGLDPPRHRLIASPPRRARERFRHRTAGAGAICADRAVRALETRSRTAARSTTHAGAGESAQGAT